MRTCPCCESEDVSLSFRKDGADYYKCGSCDLTFILPRPGSESLRKHYEEYGREYYSRDGMSEYLISEVRYRREIALLEQATRPGRLLDVGCSVGGFVKAASERGYAAQGIDISAPSVAVGRKHGLQIYAGDFLTEAFAERFDVITMWATLEHLPDPNRYIERARQLLQPGGVILASVPNFSGISQRLIGKKDRYVGIDHLNYWKARTFAEYFTRFGFEVFRTVSFGFNPITLWTDLKGGEKRMDCEEMAQGQLQSAALKRSLVRYLHRGAERLLDLGTLGDAVAVAARLRR